MRPNMEIIAHALRALDPQVYLDHPQISQVKSLKLIHGSIGTLTSQHAYLGCSEDFSCSDFLYSVSSLPAVGLNLIIVGPCPEIESFLQQGKHNVVLLPAYHSLSSIFNLIQDTFDWCNEWEKELQGALLHQYDIEYMLDVCQQYNVFENPFAFTDSLTWYTRGDHAQEYLTSEISDTLDLADASPAILSNTSIPTLATPCGNGLLLVFGTQTDLDTWHTHASRILVDNLTACLSKTKTYEEDIRPYFFTSILERRTLYPSLVQVRLQPFGWSCDDKYQVLKAICPSGALPSQTLCSLRNWFPAACSTEYNGGAAVLINATHSSELSDAPEALQAFCQQHQLILSIGPVVEGLFSLPLSWESAVSTLDLGKVFDPQSTVYHYADYVVPSIVRDLAAQKNLRLLIRPSILRLFEYDKAKGTEYLHTLRCYFSNDKNILESAAALHVHRNTLVYRMERIRKISGEDFLSEASRTHAFLSFSILDYLTAFDSLSSPTPVPVEDRNAMLQHWKF